MNIKIETHDNSGDLKRKLKEVSNWNVSDSTKTEVIEFTEKSRIGQVNLGKKLSDRTLSKNLSLLKKCLEIINKPTPKITKEDVERFDKELNKTKLKSVSCFRIILKTFLKWKLGEDKSRNLAGWLDCRDKNKTPDYLTEQEIQKLFDHCKNYEEKFLISVLFDSGARAEEFLNIRYEDIELPDNNSIYPKIILKEEYSKTLGRNISLYWKESLKSVRGYLKQREEEGIKSSEPIYKNTYDGMRFFLTRLSQKVLNKKIHPHLFRHSSATHYARKLNRQELCYRYGWKFSSNMPDVYISRSGMESKQLDEKFKSTELETIEKKFELEKFETQKELEEHKQQIESLVKHISDVNKQLKIISEKQKGGVE